MPFGKRDERSYCFPHYHLYHPLYLKRETIYNPFINSPSLIFFRFCCVNRELFHSLYMYRFLFSCLRIIRPLYFNLSHRPRRLYI